MLERVVYKGSHRQSPLKGEWTPTGDKKYRWKVVITIGYHEWGGRLCSCPPSWEATKRVYDELTGEGQPVQKKHKTKPALNLVG